MFAAENEAESLPFLRRLAALINVPPDGVDPYVLVTIRADSMNALLRRWPELGLEEPRTMVLAPLSVSAYRDVILKPAAVYSQRVERLSIEPDLSEALVRDAAGADALPLLAFTLEKLFLEFGQGGELTLQRYDGMGGIGGSIDRALADAQCRAGGNGDSDSLHRLIIPGLATWDSAAGAAKRIVAKEADLIGGVRSALAPLADALVEARLLTRNRDTLEVAHEALLRRPPISGWLEVDRELLVWRDGVERARADFEAGRRGRLAGREVEVARAWLSLRDASDLPPANRGFVEDSIAEDEARRREEEKKKRDYREAFEEAAKEVAEAANKAAQSARRVTLRTIAGLVAALAFALLAGGFGFYALEQSRLAAERGQEANQRLAQFSEAESHFLAPQAEVKLKGGYPVEATLLAVAGLPDPATSEIEQNARRKAPEIAEAYEVALAQLRERIVLSGHLSAVNSVAFSLDGRRIVSASNDRTSNLGRRDRKANRRAAERP